VLITKTDLLPLLDDFDIARAEQSIKHLAIQEPVATLSAKNGNGLDGWIDWLENAYRQQASRRAAGETRSPKIQPEGTHLHAHG
jgi:hydrogenase nickel incorporation protein HypB